MTTKPVEQTQPIRTVLTLALGRPLYLELAFNLARSFAHHHPGRTYRFVIITDMPVELPPELAFCEITTVRRGEFGEGFTPKLSIDLFAGPGPTLFLDSDVLIYEHLERVFSLLAGRAVATVGEQLGEGEWFGDIKAYCSKLGVTTIPKFNGGLYYLEPGPLCTKVFSTARDLASRYDALGLRRLRGLPNEELAIAGAMAQCGINAFPDDGSFMADPESSPGTMKLNVLRGIRELRNPPEHPLHYRTNPFLRQSPTVVHFLNDHTRRAPYRAELFRLRNSHKPLGGLLVRIFPQLCILWPERLKDIFKDLLRPLFRKLVGTRRIPPTLRTSKAPDQAPPPANASGEKN